MVSGSRCYIKAFRALQRHGNGFDDIAEDGLGGLGFFLQGSMARAGYHPVSENRDGEPLEIVG